MNNNESFHDYSKAPGLDFTAGKVKELGAHIFASPVCKLSESNWTAFLRNMKEVDMHYKPEILAVESRKFTRGHLVSGIQKSIAYGPMTNYLLIDGEFAGFIAQPHDISTQNMNGPTGIVLRPLLEMTDKIDATVYGACRDYVKDGRLMVLNALLSNLTRLGIPFDKEIMVRNIQHFSALMTLPPPVNSQNTQAPY